MKTIKMLYSVYMYSRSFIFSSLSRDEKMRIGGYDDALEKKIFDILMQEVSNNVIDGKVSQEFALGFKTGLATRQGVSRQYKSMK